MATIEEDVEFKILQEKAPNVKIYILLCDNYDCTHHFTKNTTTWEVDNKHEWLLNLTCKVCKSTWSICSHCCKTKTKFSTTKQINMHRLTYHGNKRKQKIINPTNLVTKKQKMTTKIIDIVPEVTMVVYEAKSINISDDVPVANENGNDSLTTLHEIDIIPSLIVCVLTRLMYNDLI